MAPFSFFIVIFKVWLSLEPVFCKFNKLLLCFRRKRRHKRRALTVVPDDFHGSKYSFLHRTKKAKLFKAARYGKQQGGYQ